MTLHTRRMILALGLALSLFVLQISDFGARAARLIRAAAAPLNNAPTGLRAGHYLYGQ